MTRPGEPSLAWLVVLIPAFFVGVLSFYFAYVVIDSHMRLSSHWRLFERDEAPKVREALEDGGASVWAVTSDSVIVIETNDEDIGPAYLYDLGDGTTLFLRDPDHLPKDEDDPWPACHFEVVRTALHGLWLGIVTARGEPARVRTVDLDETPAGTWLPDDLVRGSILPETPDEVLARLRAANPRRG